MEKIDHDFTTLGSIPEAILVQLEATLRVSEDYLKSPTQELESLRKDYEQLKDDNASGGGRTRKSEEGI